MYLSIWLGIAMSTTQTGCSIFNGNDAPHLASNEVRRATIVDDSFVGRLFGKSRGNAATIINPNSPIPNVLPPGARTRYSSIHTDEPVIAMTFDDGPHPSNTPKLLDMLKERNIKATFFLVGERVRMYPQLVRRILAEGHEIGNHTYTHVSLTNRTDDQIRVELQRSADALREVAGYTTHLIRPPFGATSKRVEQWIFNEFGYSSILWSVDPQDWRRPGVSVVQSRLIKGAHRGAIMLAHDIHSPTITAMPKVFDELLGKGYHFVTVSQLINIEKKTMPVGVVIPPNDAAGVTPPPSKSGRSS